MAKRNTVKTPKPTGLSITRNEDNYTVSWKQAKKYNQGQILGWCLLYDNVGDHYTKLDLKNDKTDTSKTVKVSRSNYYPHNSHILKYIKFRVRGNTNIKQKGKDPTWSDWAYCQYQINFPARPSVWSSDNNNAMTRTFNWTCNAGGANVTTDIEYQSMLSTSAADGAQLPWNGGLGWMTGTGSAAGSIDITETITPDENTSYIRWLRCRSRGPRGASEWSYTSFTYAYPPRAGINAVSARNNSANGMDISIGFNAGVSRLHPCSSAVIQYCIATPGANNSIPSGASWQDGFTINSYTGGNDTVNFSVDNQLADDQCLFVRVVTDYGGNKMNSAGKIAMLGSLAEPTLTSVSVDTSTNKATVTATNNSTVSDSRLQIVLVLNGQTYKVGTVEHGGTSTTVQCPDLSSDTSYTFGIYAFAGNMVSATTWKNGTVPKAPENVTVTPADIDGTVTVSWSWTWSNATGAVIAWADHSDAWESTDQPKTYEVSSLNASRINVSGLETGKSWYFRIRLTSGSGENETDGPWSDIITVDLTSAPATPTLVLSDEVITAGDTFTASWGYVTTDGTAQGYAEICECAVGDTVTYGTVIAHTATAQSIDIAVDDLGWDYGTHYLACRVCSASGRQSDGWSVPVPVIYAKPISIGVTLSLSDVTLTDSDGNERTVSSLTTLPMTATVTGAGEGGETILVIERAEDYHMERPDESEADGYEGETIARKSQTGEAEMSITADDLTGRLDDGAAYNIVATVKDTYGQTETVTQRFEVHWLHQAVIPSATVSVDSDNMTATITPAKPDGALDTDVCDIYRLSADAPELIVQGGIFGTAYVDPYPALGENGGHRVVLRTANGDYITADNLPAWVDLGEDDGDIIGTYSVVIDFGGERVSLPYNIKLDNSWDKDFQQTKYLGGSITGDWNPGVERKLSVSTDYFVLSGVEDDVTADLMRRLAEYTGLCHVRTPDGSSFTADVEVSEAREADSIYSAYSLTVERVDPEGFDGMTLSEWQEIMGE